MMFVWVPEMFHPILLLLGFWYILPAYVANGFAVFSKLCRTRHPIDHGCVLRDGNPLFGAGKTWEGLIIGFSAGACVGVLQYALAPLLLGLIEQYLFLPDALRPIVLLSIPQVLLVALGALLGDILGAFIKRRINIPRGRPAPILDQLAFLSVAILLGMMANPLPLILVGFLLLATPAIHLLANAIAYLLRLKDVPW
jgi:CDP-2,3-bis-(O-geranylgeranyl)-sn-glycerol synthase